MNRRTFVQSVAAAAGCIGLTAATNSADLLGLMTPERCQRLRSQGRYLRTMIDEVDITHNCTLANDREGWALVFDRDSRGLLILEGLERDRLAKTKIYGKVAFVSVTAAEWFETRSRDNKLFPHRIGNSGVREYTRVEKADGTVDAVRVTYRPETPGA